MIRKQKKYLGLLTNWTYPTLLFLSLVIYATLQACTDITPPLPTGASGDTVIIHDTIHIVDRSQFLKDSLYLDSLTVEAQKDITKARSAFIAHMDSMEAEFIAIKKAKVYDNIITTSNSPDTFYYDSYGHIKSKKK